MTDLLSPRTLDEALRRLAESPGCIPVAGCTDWMVNGALERADAPVLLDLLRVDDLRGIRPEGTGVRIGATTTFAELQHDPGMRESYPILVQAASEIGGRQIQNRATIGGNIVNASPAGDSLPVLLGLGAEVELVSVNGSRRLAYSEFHTGYRQTELREGELLSAVHLPTAPSFQRFRKVGTRRAQAISKVVVACCGERRDGRWSKIQIAAGSVAATPVRLGETEAAAEGMPVSASTAEAVAEIARNEVQPIDDVRSTASYRSWVLGRVIRRMLLE
jgi:CO/xanthine dehydrogenase FAD-binding subunit